MNTNARNDQPPRSNKPFIFMLCLGVVTIAVFALLKTSPKSSSVVININKGKVSQSAANGDGISVSLPATGSSSSEGKPLVPTTGCYTFTYKHKAIAGHGDRESCSTHRNAVKPGAAQGYSILASNQINQKSLCVKVDGVPVKFERKNDLLLFGSVAGPSSVVTVQVCLGKSSCAGDCAVPKDQFMDAIGATADNDSKDRAPAAAAKWDPNDKENDTDAANEVDAELLQEVADVQESPVFKDWLEVDQSPVCNSAVTGRL